MQMDLLLLLRGIARPLHQQNPQPARFAYRIRCLSLESLMSSKKGVPGLLLLMGVDAAGIGGMRSRGGLKGKLLL